MFKLTLWLNIVILGNVISVLRFCLDDSCKLYKDASNHIEGCMEGIMTKLHFTLIILGSALFFWDISYGVGWLIGWLFAGLLRQYREKLLDHLIDFDNFSVTKYIAYLFGVVIWIAIPFLISFLLPDYINPIFVFLAFFVDRALMFIMRSIRKET